MILVIDNYDSFVHNLARHVRQLGFKTTVVRNDLISLEEIEELSPSHIVLSPGPCTPNEAGLTKDIIATFHKNIPMLGVCLGHQAIGQIFGATVTTAQYPMHGKRSTITHDNSGILNDLPTPLTVARYHSLIVSSMKFPECLEITAISTEGEIMAIAHKNYPTFGVQFHPESVLTQKGYRLLKNFLSI